MKNTEYFHNSIVNLECLSIKNGLFCSTFRFVLWIHFMYEMDDDGELCLINISSKLVNAMKSSITKTDDDVGFPLDDKKSRFRSNIFNFWSRNKKTDENHTKETFKENEAEKLPSETVSNHDSIRILNIMDLALNRIFENIRLCKIKFYNIDMRYDRRIRFEKIKKEFLRSIINGNSQSNRCFACHIYARNVLLRNFSHINKQEHLKSGNSARDSGLSSEDEGEYETKLITNKRKNDVKNSEIESRKIVEIVFEKSDLHIFNFKSPENQLNKSNECVNIIINKKISDKLESGMAKCYEKEGMGVLIDAFSLFVYKKDYCGIFLLSKILLNLHRKTNYKKNKFIDELLSNIKPKFKSFYLEIEKITPLSCSEHQYKINLKKLKTHSEEIISNIWGTDLNQ